METFIPTDRSINTASIKADNIKEEYRRVPGFYVLSVRKIWGSDDYLLTLLFENPQIGLKETITLPMSEVRSPAKFRKKIPPAFTTPYKPSKMVEDLQYEIGLAFNRPGLHVECALQQGFSCIEDDLFYVIGDCVLPDVSMAKGYSVQAKDFSAVNPNETQLYLDVLDQSKLNTEEIIAWIHAFCEQGPAQTVLFLCAMTPYMKHVLPEKFSEESVVHAYVFGESGVGKTEQIKLMARITNGAYGINLESDMKDILVELTGFRDRAVQIDDLNRTASEAIRAKKEAKVSSLLQMGSSAAGNIRTKDVNVDLSNTALLISAEYVLGNFSTINRAVLLHIRETFDGEKLTYLQENRGLYGRFLLRFISFICMYRNKIQKIVGDFYSRESFYIPNVRAADEYAGFPRIFRHYEILRLTAYAIVKSLPTSKQREEFAKMFKEATDSCIADTLKAVQKNAVTDFVKTFLGIFEKNIVAESPNDYHFGKRYVFFYYKEYLYFRGKDLTDYFLNERAESISSKTISKELGKSGLLVMYGNNYSEKLTDKLDKKIGGSGEHFYRINVNVLLNMLDSQYGSIGCLYFPVVRIHRKKEQDKKNKKKG